MASDQFLKIATIEGESSDSKHKGEIEVISMSWGATQTASMQNSATGGGGQGKVTFHDISFTKVYDKSTPLLVQHCAQGDNIGECTFTARKAAGKDALEYLKIKMNDCIVSSIKTQTTKTPEGATILEDFFTINFAKVEINYTPQNADGTGAGVVAFTHTLNQNT